MDDLEDKLRKTIRIKLLERGINPGSLEDIDLDQYSSEDDSRYEKIEDKLKVIGSVLVMMEVRIHRPMMVCQNI